MTLTNRLSALALTVLASATLLVGAVGPAQQGATTSVSRTVA
jgi:hypothetical protein